MTTDARIQLRQQLKRDEGPGPMKNGRHLLYRCPEGFWTGGYGHNFDAKGLTPAQADRLLDDDINDAIRDLLTKFPWIEALDPVRQAVLVNMAFNMGVPRLAGFRKMWAALQKREYEQAAVEMLSSNWAEQVGARASRLAEQMRSGKFSPVL